ncbi:Cobaltochelatase [Desulfobulbus propionicus DSM 2032]|uniref:Cobaltochelatase n=1 Tax=Desulfobulbus propionicus (strain ATCC 33891 / DSM 2032 / VKM B-1956 / 1pr3) TaxID=577650 RepID=A0A7U3YPL9_DESPD|nr:cobaltochelatase subunit CobN [Desulfobulbus propionicus]ADW19232.1 Cobaltochelatase [Desulfobulbus propionicus DSM 2032]
MKILFVHGQMFQTQTWSRAYALLLAEGVELRFYAQHVKAGEAIKLMASGWADLCIVQLFRDLPQYEALLEAASSLPHRIDLGPQRQPGFTTFTAKQAVRFSAYLEQVSLANFVNGIHFLVACATGTDHHIDPPEQVRTCGIYHAEHDTFFFDTSDYLRWQCSRISDTVKRPLVALLCYYGQIVENNHAEIDALIQALECQALTPLCVVTEGMTDSSLPPEQRYPWLEYLRGAAPQLLLNLLAGRLLTQPEDVTILKELNLPVVQLLRLYQQTPEQWRQDVTGAGAGAASMVFSLTQPEMAGVIEPTAVAATRGETDPVTGLLLRRYIPLPEQIERLCLRLHRWIRLRLLDNDEKRLTIVLHNNPCKGVEATLGLAAGLDTFASLAALITALREAGYDTGNAPEDGKALLDLLLARKAISEFRWTTTDEIVAKGGVLHRVDAEEYLQLLTDMPEAARQRVENDWGRFPGEGMVYRQDGQATLLVTGLRFGHLQIIVQPKRGCYGAKCNGEVCRILHDPHLSPPPHWLATYAYIRATSDAVLHFGAHGALEFLPGKQVGLSAACFPEISLGDLPNIYLYIMDVPGEGLMAKRRARAVMVDHLCPVRRPAPLDAMTLELEDLLDQYQKAKLHGENQRQQVLRARMQPLMQQMGGLEGEEDFDRAMELLSRRIGRSRRVLSATGPHLLGTAPDSHGIATLLATILGKPVDGLPLLAEIAAHHQPSSGNAFDDAVAVLEWLLTTTKDGCKAEPGQQPFRRLLDWCQDVGGRIGLCTREIGQLLRALDGEYIEPGLCGSLALGKTEALPTGRNFFTSDVAALPTRAAWEVGQALSDNLLRKYLEDEGRFPESVGISLWSIDAFKSDGEVFCQILALMGMRPLWQANGRVCGVEPIPLHVLQLDRTDGPGVLRPRVDVVIQTSSILRDMVPHFADLLDEAAVMAGDLPEPIEQNFIRKHTLEQLDELRRELGEQHSGEELRRMASFRVFSSAPGASGTGVGLALDASAWNDEADLAETYINWSGFAYGSDRISGFERVQGVAAHRLFAARLKDVEVSYMRQASPEYDATDCSCYTGCLGGMSVAAKALTGKRARIYFADNNSEADHSVRDFQEDLEATTMAKLLNPHWIDQRQQEGYQGAGEVAGRVNTLFKWSATTETVAGWVFDRVVTTYIQDQTNLEWLRRENPYGLEEITRRLLEAQSRGLWQADAERLAAVQEAALLIEGDMEESIGEVREEFQGSKVEVMTAADVEKWRPVWRLERLGQ